MTILKNAADIAKIKEAGNILKDVFTAMEKAVSEGVSTAELDAIAEEIIRSKGAEPAFKGYKGYPSTICASINEVVVHGIPSDEAVLTDGDIIGIDVGAKKNGFFADAARTFSVGTISDEAERLKLATKRCLDEGVKMAIAGNRLFDISNAIQAAAEEAGFKEVRAFVGHGIGTELHEPPEVPNWGKKGKGQLLEEGLVLAIEPMINAGTRDVQVLDDGWTAVTADGKLSAHFEDTIIVGKQKTEIVT